MPYTINRYNGQPLANGGVIADGTVDNSTDLKLIGKNYAGYGEIQNENFVFLLENFSNPNPPPKALSGQIWFDSQTKKLKFNDGAFWRTTGGAEVGATQPSGLTTGDFWFDTANEQLYAFNGTDYTLIGPQGVAGSGTTQMRSRSVRDINGGNHAIIEATVNGATIFTISADSAFEIDRSTHALPDLTGYSVIRQGVTLYDTYNSSFPGQTQSNHRFWGTATNSDRLGGYTASEFVRSSLAGFSTLVNFSDEGYTVGNSPRLKVWNEGALTPTIKNMLNESIVFQTTLSGTRTPLRLVGANLIPGEPSVSNIGSAQEQFGAVYANTFSGTAAQADTLNVSGSYRTASTTASSGTVAVRTSADETIGGVNVTAGALKATFFVGTATSANYADLAENYLADAVYEVGTVVSVGGEKEVTASKWGDRALGVVSEKPAYLMNSGLTDGTPIALKGRVPVKVTGAVRKGQRLVASNNGTAVAAVPHANDVFGIALESSDDTGVKLVECVVL